MRLGLCSGGRYGVHVGISLAELRGLCRRDACNLPLLLASLSKSFRQCETLERSAGFRQAFDFGVVGFVKFRL